MSCKKGDWVQIHQIVLTSDQRAPQVPEDTSKVPLELWVKGYAMNDVNIGEELEIKTITGRKIIGKLVAIQPKYDYGFGEFVPELHLVGTKVKELLYGGESK
jgi:hypothetical protein